MTTQDLIAGYAAYTDAAELGQVDDAAAITPTTSTASSAPCAASVASATASIALTIKDAC
ncbi:LxmA leader domain family RiPP [Nocardioides zeae]|uniref:LxmA leader domain family RiPP n=1 Tax=Nocardioides imazamoxiresistens TaxID=3231893 RepID=A0ABU3PV50_9ACTN|nr:LxmA leader domain family RiPP [Nocardioides zeae]MDT9593113.1 LxmA leader domain family RiPP [Nocardioides zeae]